MGNVMIRVTQERDSIYTVELDMPELNLLYQIAAGFKMPRTEALKTAISRGFDSTVNVLHEIAAYETRKREQGDNEG